MLKLGVCKLLDRVRPFSVYMLTASALILCLDYSALLLAAEGVERPVEAKPAPVPAKRVQLPAIPLSQALETRGDLTLQDTTMEKALLTIGVSWRVNIVIGKDVQGKISCVYRDTPLREVLDAILLANGYSYRAVGESLVVQKVQEVGSANPLFQSAFISITHSDLDEIVEGARLLISTQGQISALESARSIVVVDFADRVATVRDFVAKMDAAASEATGGIPAETYKRLEVAYFHTQYIPVDNVKDPLDAVLSQVGRVATMPDENRMIVVDYASNIEMVKRVLEKIDRPRPQVRITALIYDISLQDVEQLGFNWNSAGKGNTLDADGNANQAISLATQTMAPITAGANGGAFAIQSLTRNFDIRTVAQFLQNANDARLLADPHVTVEENETADMSSVQEIPFQQLTQSALGGQIGTTAFKKVGIMLKVVPTVAADGTIRLTIEQEFSRLTGFTENDDQPIIDSRTANTTVRVANRHTLVIGGLRQRSDTGEFNGIPFLKDIRYIGPLFRSRDTTVRESELIIFIMPEIIDYDQASLAREYLAQETIGCRLQRIPKAEGCGGPNGQGGANCEVTPGGEIVGDQLMLLPVVGEKAGELVLPQATEPSAGVNTVPLRQGFGDRYRATGGTDARRQRLIESAPKPQEPRNAKSSKLKRIFGL
ncbi:MAG: type II secretion system protein GspD [Planctomycetes bacterium]|nr:type II secretion system protein GspD [Planctomycetota bacterium]